MARLIRSLVVIGCIAVLSPVHEGEALRQSASGHGRSLFASLMPASMSLASSMSLPNSFPGITAQTAVAAARQFSALEPETQQVLLQLAAAQISQPVLSKHVLAKPVLDKTVFAEPSAKVPSAAR